MSAPRHAGARGGADLGPVAAAVLRRPSLWCTALVEAARLGPSGWWRAWPPVPRPTEEWWRFRMECAYGGRGDDVPEPEDAVEYLRWCRDMGEWRRL